MTMLPNSNILLIKICIINVEEIKLYIIFKKWSMVNFFSIFILSNNAVKKG